MKHSLHEAIIKQTSSKHRADVEQTSSIMLAGRDSSTSQLHRVNGALGFAIRRTELKLQGQKMCCCAKWHQPNL